MQSKNVHIHDSIDLQAMALAKSFANMVLKVSQKNERINIALSGGGTPRHFFKALTIFQDTIDWQKIHIYWVDERCVPPDHRESNFGMTKEHLLDKIDIPFGNIHRIIGESEPEVESKRYSQEIKEDIRLKNQWPVFDWILLGLGEDGHTASLFPDSTVLDENRSISAVAKHPQSGQMRITLTFPALNNAADISFLVSGVAKSQIIRDILAGHNKHHDYPAARIMPVHGIVSWYLDKKAAKLL
jgi:6-phosphogluconolactonase